MLLLTLSLTRGLILRFAFVDLSFRRGHHALRQRFEILKGRWAGFAHNENATAQN